MIGELESLHPLFRAKVDAILKDMKSQGWDPIVGSGIRSSAQQEALYAQGRDQLDQVNTLRLKAKLPLITSDQNAKVVTHSKAGKSYHNMPEAIFPDGASGVVRGYGYAVDIVDRKRGWEAVDAFWEDLGTSAKSQGCEWGGDWKTPDRAHVQMLLIDMAPENKVTV